MEVVQTHEDIIARGLLERQAASRSLSTMTGAASPDPSYQEGYNNLGVTASIARAAVFPNAQSNSCALFPLNILVERFACGSDSQCSRRRQCSVIVHRILIAIVLVIVIYTRSISLTRNHPNRG